MKKWQASVAERSLGASRPLTRVLPAKLPFRWILLGTMLPDLIDKPIFLLFSRLEYFQNAGWSAGKRGFAHTLLFLLMLTLLSWRKRSLALAALSAGAATHLVLDVISKASEGSTTAFGSLRVLFWPIAGWTFPILSHGMHGVEIWAFEAIGLCLLILHLTVKKSR